LRAIAEEASELVRKFKGAYSGEHGDGLCRGEWISWQFGPKINEAFRDIKQLFDPISLLSPQRMVDPPRMDDTRLMRFPPTYKVIPLRPALDWRAWDVQNDPATERVSASGHRRRPGARLRQGGGDVQQQRALPQVRRRHHVPELPRHARRAALDARARQHAAAGGFGPAGTRRPGQPGSEGCARISA
jgi:hypothetical protein